MTDETKDALMQATYRALCNRGYANLRMRDIADESEKSKATLHYHYESKQDLLESFLEYIFEWYTDRLDEAEAAADATDPLDRLRAVIDTALRPPADDEPSPIPFQTAILEIKAQAPYNAAFRSQLVEGDRYLHRRIRSIVDDGVESGRFRADVDPDEVADFVVTAVNGARTRHVAVEHPVERTRESLHRYVERWLLAPADDPEAAVRSE